jgi:hypothetical protein
LATLLCFEFSHALIRLSLVATYIGAKKVAKRSEKMIFLIRTVGYFAKHFTWIRLVYFPYCVEAGGRNQGCQMVYFQTKNPNVGKFWSVLGRLENVGIFYGHLEYFVNIWDMVSQLGTFCVHLVYCVFIWYIL